MSHKQIKVCKLITHTHWAPDFISVVILAGQLALKNSGVLIVGAGGLGCPSAIYLAASGIGRSVEAIILNNNIMEYSYL